MVELANPSIEAVNLSKNFGFFVAVSNLNLKIEGSKCVGFLGPNGAGKTTMLKIFTDLIRASSGQVYSHLRSANNRKCPDGAYPPHTTNVGPFTIYVATIPEGLAIMALYFNVAVILGLLLFERKEFT